MRYTAVALHVPDLETAETYYAGLFDLELVGREARLPDGDGGEEAWGTLPHGRTWADARAAGTELTFTSLQRDGFHLALMAGQPQHGDLYAIVVIASAAEIARCRDALVDEEVIDSDPAALEFIDRHGVRWQLRTSAGWSTPGRFAGRWLDV